ncbi:hypothetical protein [Spirosoma telluris]|uniref:hypothetical protein n=1 Tax=Spirosoma telluris TaxID=2183553 RepID=UPI002FC28F27
MAKIGQQNPAWFIYFDVMLAAYVYPILVRCETDPKIRSFYENHMDQWLEQRKADKNPLINFLYCYSRDKKVELAPSIDFLVDTPLDLINWTVDHTKREDVAIVRTPVLDELQVNELPQPVYARLCAGIKIHGLPSTDNPILNVSLFSGYSPTGWADTWV